MSNAKVYRAISIEVTPVKPPLFTIDYFTTGKLFKNRKPNKSRLRSHRAMWITAKKASAKITKSAQRIMRRENHYAHAYYHHSPRTPIHKRLEGVKKRLDFDDTSS